MELFVSEDIVSVRIIIHARGVCTERGQPTVQLAQDDAPATTDHISSVRKQWILGLQTYTADLSLLAQITGS